MSNTAYFNLVVLNEGLRNQDGESLEESYIKITVGDFTERITIDAYKNCDDLWTLLESYGLNLGNIANDIVFDPFIDLYIKRNYEDMYD